MGPPVASISNTDRHLGQEYQAPARVFVMRWSFPTNLVMQKGHLTPVNQNIVNRCHGPWPGACREGETPIGSVAAMEEPEDRGSISFGEWVTRPWVALGLFLIGAGFVIFGFHAAAQPTDDAWRWTTATFAATGGLGIWLLESVRADEVREGESKWIFWTVLALFWALMIIATTVR